MILRRLEKADEKTFFKAFMEWNPDAVRHWFSCYDSSMSFDQLLKKLDDEHNGINLPEHFVPCTVMYGFVKDKQLLPKSKLHANVTILGSWIIGRLSIRHRLSEHTKIYGGHVGYAVTEKYRGQGYGYEMLKQALPMCADLGIKEVLLTVNQNNAASIGVIKKCGGKFVDSFFDESHNRVTERYQINV